MVWIYWTLLYIAFTFQATTATNLNDPHSVVRKTRNSESRPIIYTFFEPKKRLRSSQQKEAHYALLEAWKDLWTQAGWEPRILTLDDARKHPDYEKFSEAIITKGNLYQGSYDYMCFMRWLAMAAHGQGGWMSDNDVFPTGIDVEQGLTIPHDGKFTGWDRHVPCLLSGSSEEWNKVTSLLMTHAIEKVKHSKWYSDMDCLRDLHIEDPDLYIQRWKKVFSGFPYTKGKNVIDCRGVISESYVVHLSHSDTASAIGHGLVTYSGKGDIGKNVEKVRPNLAREFDENWKLQCVKIAEK